MFDSIALEPRYGNNQGTNASALVVDHIHYVPINYDELELTYIF